MRFFWYLIFVLVLVDAKSQDSLVFRSPIDYTTILSGSYAEPRTAHFHAGIDFKQKKGVPHDSILAVADGYISRINVKPDGYGNALYIDHPNGYTSVYAHLHEFSKGIKDYITKILYDKKKHQIIHYLDKNEYPIKMGEFLGYMGNTGRSSAPHLHFEIRETKSEKSVNPALFGFKPTDNLNPTINGIVIYSIGPDGEILGQKYHKTIYRGEGNYVIDQSLIFSGAVTIGIGIHCYDTMNGAKNHNGIYGIESYVNGAPNYSFQLDKIAFENSNYIHSHMDYGFKKQNKYVSKCFKVETNPLGIYKNSIKNGLVALSEKISSNIKIRAYDIEGNEALVSFNIKRKEQLDPMTRQYGSDYIRIKPNNSYKIKSQHFTIEIDSMSVDKPEYIKITTDSNQVHITSPTAVPFFKYFKIRSAVDSSSLADNKVYISKNEKGQEVSYGSKVSNSEVYTYTNRLGTYSIVTDSINPHLESLRLPSSNSNEISFVIKDNYETTFSKDALQFELYINDKWTLCQHDIKRNKVWYRIENERTNTKQVFKIVLTDGAGNTMVKQGKFIY